MYCIRFGLNKIKSIVDKVYTQNMSNKLFGTFYKNKIIRVKIIMTKSFTEIYQKII